jgi:hypothetical protein
VHDILSILPSLFVKIFFPEPAWQVAGCFLKTAFLLKSQMVSSSKAVGILFFRVYQVLRCERSVY